MESALPMGRGAKTENAAAVAPRRSKDGASRPAEAKEID